MPCKEKKDKIKQLQSQKIPLNRQKKKNQDGHYLIDRLDNKYKNKTIKNRNIKAVLCELVTF